MRGWIKTGIIFVSGGITTRVLDRLLDWSESALLPVILGSSISDIIFVLGIVIGIIFIAFGVWKSKETELPKEARSVRDFFHTRFLTHLTIHYSRLTDNPDSPNPARPRFVTNNRTNQAFWVSTFIDNNRHAINYHTHNGEQELRNYLQTSKYTINERDPTPEELGISQDGKEKTKSVVKLTQLNDLITRLTNFIYDPIPTLITETFFVNFRIAYCNLMTEAEGYIGHEEVNSHIVSLEAPSDPRLAIELAKTSATHVLNSLRKYQENLE